MSSSDVPFWGPDFAALRSQDPQLADILLDELERQRTGLQLIASENFTSPAVMAALGSSLTNTYAEGYPASRYYGGCQVVDRAEDIARGQARALLDAEHANVQPHSGVAANLAACAALLTPGDTVLAMSLPHGGHLTHGSRVNFSGKWFRVVSYGVRRDTERIDYDEVRDLALRHRPEAIVCGAAAYPRLVDFAAFREIADEVGAWLLVDAAHVIGLVAGGAIPSPVPYADVVTFTTHKVRGKDAEERCEAVDMAVNKNAIPYDPEPPTIASGLRVGTAEVTTQGMVEPEMREIAELLAPAVRDHRGSAAAQLRDGVGTLVDRYPAYPGPC